MISHAVKKTISLPADLAREAEEVARIDGKSFSAVVQQALRSARTARLTRELHELQGYWSRLAPRGEFSLRATSSAVSSGEGRL
jgi:metal-responsive CopG/Arc/MetJ family transcriptional regulator